MTSNSTGSPYEPPPTDTGQHDHAAVPANPSDSSVRGKPPRRHVLLLGGALVALVIGIATTATALAGRDYEPSRPQSVDTYEPEPEPDFEPAPEPEPDFDAEPAPEPEPDFEPAPEPEPDPGIQVPAPPQSLVGRWNGGPGDSTDWYLTINADGSYILINDWLGLYDSGLVDTSGNGFEMYNETGDGSVVDAAAVNGCEWHFETVPSFGDLPAVTILYFCGQASGWSRA